MAGAGCPPYQRKGKHGYAENSRFDHVYRMPGNDCRIRVTLLYYHVREPVMTINNTDGYERLAYAVMCRAAKDAMSTDAELADEAIDWMMDVDCEMYCGALRIDHQRVMRYAKNCVEDDRGTR